MKRPAMTVEQGLEFDKIIGLTGWMRSLGTREEAVASRRRTGTFPAEAEAFLRRLRWPASQNLPARLPSLRTSNLQPWPKGALTEKTQAKLIDLIPTDPEEPKLNWWLLLGPAGSSKTTYISTAVYDWLDAEEPNVWRVVVPTWLDAMNKWDTRDFADSSKNHHL